MFIGDGWSFSSGGRSQVADLKETHEYSGSQYGNPISKKFRIVQVSERIFAGRYQGIQIKDLLVLAKVQEGVILESFFFLRFWRVAPEKILVMWATPEKLV